MQCRPLEILTGDSIARNGVRLAVEQVRATEQTACVAFGVIALLSIVLTVTDASGPGSRKPCAHGGKSMASLNPFNGDGRLPTRVVLNATLLFGASKQCSEKGSEEP